jgi:hypothetical protein
VGGVGGGVEGVGDGGVDRSIDGSVDETKKIYPFKAGGRPNKIQLSLKKWLDVLNN